MANRGIFHNQGEGEDINIMLVSCMKDEEKYLQCADTTLYREEYIEKHGR